MPEYFHSCAVFNPDQSRKHLGPGGQSAAGISSESSEFEAQYLVVATASYIRLYPASCLQVEFEIVFSSHPVEVVAIIFL